MKIPLWNFSSIGGTNLLTFSRRFRVEADMLVVGEVIEGLDMGQSVLNRNDPFVSDRRLERRMRIGFGRLAD